MIWLVWLYMMCSYTKHPDNGQFAQEWRITPGTILNYDTTVKRYVRKNEHS